jgi:tetratricopeptide (TPR) repeat protein
MYKVSLPSSTAKKGSDRDKAVEKSLVLPAASRRTKDRDNEDDDGGDQGSSDISSIGRATILICPQSNLAYPATPPPTALSPTALSSMAGCTAAASKTDFENVSALNQMAIRWGLSGQYRDSMKCFEQAFSLLRVSGSLVLSPPPTAYSTEPHQLQHQQPDHPPMGTADGFDERVEYDEGWSLCSLSSSSISVDQLGPLAPYQEVAAALLYNFGQVLLLQNEHGRAKAVFVDAYVMARSSCTDQTHLLLIPILHRIGYLQYWERDIHSAIATYLLALDICRESPPDQQHALRMAVTLNCLGVLHFHLQVPESETSREYLLLALDLQQKTLGRDDAAVATTLNNLGRVYFTSERYVEALDAYQSALQIRRLLLGNCNLDVAATVYNCGQTLQRLGRRELAIECYKEFVGISAALRRPNRYLVIALKSIAALCHELKNCVEAVTYYHQALLAGQEILGLHTEVAAIYNKLGNLYYEMGSVEDALRVYEQGLAVERAVLDRYHPNIAVTLCNIAQIHKQRGNIPASLQLYEEALDLQRNTSAFPDPSAAVTLANIGLIHYQTKQYGVALEKFQEALLIRQELGEDNLDVASCLNSMGLVLFKLGLPEIALQRFIESLRIRRKLQGETHRDVATILHNIATIHLELGNDDGGIRCYRESLRIERCALGPHHDDILSTLECLGKVHQHRGELRQSLQCFQEALDIRRQRPRPQQADTRHTKMVVRTLNLIANLHLQLGDVGGAMASMSEAVRLARSIPTLSEDDVELSGYELYGFSKLHPEASAAA